MHTESKSLAKPVSSAKGGEGPTDSQKRAVDLEQFNRHVATCPACSPFGLFLCAEGTRLLNLVNHP